MIAGLSRKDTAMGELVELRQETGYRFENRFGAGIDVLHSDEPAPLGAGTGPSPVQLLAAAVANCLSASLVFAFRKFRQAAEPVSARAEAVVGRNEEKRLRVQGIEVRLTLGVPAASLEDLEHVLARFEEYCTVTASVRQAIPVAVAVYDSEGARLK